MCVIQIEGVGGVRGEGEDRREGGRYRDFLTMMRMNGTDIVV